MRLKAFLVLCLFIAAGIGAFLYWKPQAGTSSAAAKQQGGALPVEAASVRSGRLDVTLNTVGSLKANESLVLKPEISGRIETIYFEEGAPVKKGAPLIHIDDRIYAAELKQAEAALNLARANYDRAKVLKEKGAGTASNLDTAQAALGVAQAQVDLARATLDKTKIAAPFDGVMGLRKVSPGDVISPGQELAGFQSITPMKAEFTLPENATGAVAVGQTIDIVVDALAGKNFTGTIYAIDPQINESSRNIMLRATVPNDDGSLKPGLFVRVSIITAQKDNSLFVPESAIVPRGNDSYVMRVGEDHKVATVQVATGERSNGEVEITNGLAAGDIIVTAGHLKLHNGMEVSAMLPSSGEKPQ